MVPELTACRDDGPAWTLRFFLWKRDGILYAAIHIFSWCLGLKVLKNQEGRSPRLKNSQELSPGPVSGQRCLVAVNPTLMGAGARRLWEVRTGSCLWDRFSKPGGAASEATRTADLQITKLPSSRLGFTVHSTDGGT